MGIFNRRRKPNIEELARKRDINGLIKAMRVIIPFFLLLVVLVMFSTSTAQTTEYPAPSEYYRIDITHEVAVRPGGKELYVTGIHVPLILVVNIDSPDYPVLGEIQLPGGEIFFNPDIVFSHNGKYAYVARQHNDQYIESWGLEEASYIVVIDCEKREIDRIIPMRSYNPSTSLTPSPDGRYLYFTTNPGFGKPSGIGKLDLRSEEVVEYLPLVWEAGPFITISGDGKRIYAAVGEHPPSAGNNLFYVIDAESLKVKSFLEVGDAPQHVAVTPDGKKAYVSNRWTDDVTAIDLDTMKVTAVIPVGPEPREITITPNGRKAYVTLTGVTPILVGLPGYLFGRHVAVVDLEQDVLLGTIEVGIDPESISMHPDGTRVFVGDGGDPQVHVIDTTTDSYLRLIILRPAAQIVPAGIDVTPDGSKLFITSFPRDSLLVVDVATGDIINELKIEARAVRVSADGSQVYVFSPASPEREAKLHIIDSGSLKILNSIGLGKIGSATVGPLNSYRIVINSAETVAYINYETHQKDEEFRAEWTDPDDTGLVSVDLVKGKVVARIFYSDNPDISFKGMALTPDESKLFVSDPPSATVVVIDTSINTAIDRIPVANNPSEIKISKDGKRAYVLQQLGDILMTIIDVDTHEILESIEFGVHGQADFELSPDERYAYIMGFDSNFVMVYDLQEHRVVKVIDTGLNLLNSASTPDGRYIYVGEVTDDKISVVDTATNSIVKTINLIVGERPISTPPEVSMSLVAAIVIVIMVVVVGATYSLRKRR